LIDKIFCNIINPFSIKTTEVLKKLFDKTMQFPKLKLLGGFSVQFILKPPHGEEFKNVREHILLDAKNFDQP